MRLENVIRPKEGLRNQEGPHPTRSIPSIMDENSFEHFIEDVVGVR